MKQLQIKYLGALLLCIVGSVLSPTIAEFFVALINSYQIYPAGTDTDMLANTSILQFVIVIASLLPLVWLVRKLKYAIAILVVVLFCLLFISLFIPSFLPFDWCKKELRIYPCESGMMYQQE